MSCCCAKATSRVLRYFNSNLSVPRVSESETRVAKAPSLRKELLPVLGILLVFVAVWLPRLHGPINFCWDASTYYVLGTALAQGEGYRLLNEPGEIHAIQYPPLLPMVVA